MDPLSVLGLTCNTLDLLAAAGKTYAFLYKVRNEKSFPSPAELTSTTNLLKESTEALNKRLLGPQNPGQPLRPDDRQLFDVLQQSEKLATDLSTRLEAFWVQPGDSRLQTPRKALFNPVAEREDLGPVAKMGRTSYCSRACFTCEVKVRFNPFSHTHSTETIQEYLHQVSTDQNIQRLVYLVPRA
jgi:hypothetical protein